MGNTKNHNWTTPEQGSNTYPEDFESFFQEADTDVEIRDEDSNKGQYTPKAGAKFRATDTENVYIGDGNTWNKVESSGQNPSVESVSTDRVGIGPNSERTIQYDTKLNSLVVIQND